jgi:O-antigen ligase
MVLSVRGPLTTDPLARAVILAHVGLCPVVFTRATADTFEAPKAALVLATACLLAALRLSGRTVERQRPETGPAARLTNVGLALFLLSAVASTALSVSPWTSLVGAHESRAGLLALGAYSVFFLEVRRTMRGPADAARVVVTAVAAGVVAALYALAQWAGADPLAWERTASMEGRMRAFGTLGHPIVLGTYLAMALPLAVWCWRQWTRGLPAWAAAGAVFVLVLATVSTLSRGAWLAQAVVAAGGLLLSCRGGVARLRVPAVTAGALVAAGLAATIVLAWAGWARLVVQRGVEFDLGPRAMIWQAAWLAFLERPLVGWGVDTFQVAFAFHRPADFAAVEFNTTPVKAHNDLLHLLASQGLLGLLAAAVLAWAAARAARRGWLARPGGHGLVAALSASLIAWAVAGLTGFTVAATASLAVAGGALLDGLARTRAGCAEHRVGTRRPTTAGSAWRLAAGLATAGAAIAVLAARPLLASVRCRDATVRLEHDPAAAVALAAQAARLDPFQEIHHARLGQAAHAAAMRASDTREAVRLLRTARGAYLKAVALIPSSGHRRAALALAQADLALVTGRPPDEAWREFDRAFAQDPGNALLRVAAASAAQRAGDLGRARARASEARRLLPAFGAPVAQLGQVSAAEGRVDEAIALLEESLDLPWYQLEDQREMVRSNLAALRADRKPRLEASGGASTAR